MVICWDSVLIGFRWFSKYLWGFGYLKIKINNTFVFGITPLSVGIRGSAEVNLFAFLSDAVKEKSHRIQTARDAREAVDEHVQHVVSQPAAPMIDQDALRQMVHDAARHAVHEAVQQIAQEAARQATQEGIR